MFTIFSQPYYDEYNKCYLNILTLNIVPHGPLRKFVRNIKLARLSPFQVEGPCNPINKCALAIAKFPISSSSCCTQSTWNSKCQNLMTPNDLPDLLHFLTSNGYQIETQISNMLQNSGIRTTNKNMICNATYYGNNAPSVVYMR